jgi:hypothetical protein
MTQIKTFLHCVAKHRTRRTQWVAVFVLCPLRTIIIMTMKKKMHKFFITSWSRGYSALVSLLKKAYVAVMHV